MDFCSVCALDIGYYPGEATVSNDEKLYHWRCFRDSKSMKPTNYEGRKDEHEARYDKELYRFALR